MNSKSPQLKTYTVTSKTIKYIRDGLLKKEIDVIVRENGPGAEKMLTDYFREYYEPSVQVSISEKNHTVNVEWD